MDFVKVFLDIVLPISGIVGAVFAVLSARRVNIVKIQDDTITALQQRVDTIEVSLEQQKEENTRLKLLIETIQTALLKKGIHITIDGDLITISETAKNVVSSIRSRPRKTKVSIVEEEQV